MPHQSHRRTEKLEVTAFKKSEISKTNLKKKSTHRYTKYNKFLAKKKKTKCKLSQIVKMAEHQRFLITQKKILEEKQLH